MAKSPFRYINGKPLSLPVAINATAVAALLRAEYERVCGGKCDLCPATQNLDLVRRNGRRRARGVYSVTEVLNYVEVVGGRIVLPSTFTLRCRSCHRKIAAARKKEEAARTERRERTKRRAAAAEEHEPQPAGAESSPTASSSIGLVSEPAAPPEQAPPSEAIDDEVREFIAAHPTTAARIQKLYGAIEDVTKEQPLGGDGRPGDVRAWLITTPAGRIRVPALKAA